MDKSWTILGEILSKSSSLQQGSGGVGEVRQSLRLRRSKARAKAKAKAKAINQQSRLTPRVGSADYESQGERSELRGCGGAVVAEQDLVIG